MQPDPDPELLEGKGKVVLSLSPPRQSALNHFQRSSQLKMSLNKSVHTTSHSLEPR